MKRSKNTTTVKPAHAKTNFEGFGVTLTRCAEDGTVLVFIDTRPACESGHDHKPDGAPHLRVYVNDGNVYDYEKAVPAAKRPDLPSIADLRGWADHPAKGGRFVPVSPKTLRALANELDRLQKMEDGS